MTTIEANRRPRTKKSNCQCKECEAQLLAEMAAAHSLTLPLPPEPIPTPPGAELCAVYRLEVAYGIKRINGVFV